MLRPDFSESTTAQRFIDESGGEGPHGSSRGRSHPAGWAVLVAVIMVTSTLGVVGVVTVASPASLPGGNTTVSTNPALTVTDLAPSETLTPSSGPPGTVVTLSGSGLNVSQVYYYCYETTNTHIGCPSTYSFTTSVSGAIPSGVTITMAAAGYVVIAGGTAASSFAVDARFTLQSMAVLAGNVPYLFTTPGFDFLWSIAGPTSGSQVLNLTLYLADTNLTYLEILVNELNTPGNPLYHHYLTPSQFQAQFYPSSTTVNGLENYYRQHGFTVWSYSYAPTVIVLQANVSTIDTQFELTLENINVSSTYAGLENSYNYATLHNPVITNLVNPSVPSTYSSLIVSIYGMSYASDIDLNKAAITECVYLGGGCSQSGTPNGTMPGQGGVLVAQEDQSSGSLSPAGSSSLLTPPNIESYYQMNGLVQAGYNGTGQKVGIIGVGQNFVYANEAAFWATYGIYPHNVHLVNLTSNGLNPYPSGSEQELDLEMVGEMAPAAGIYDIQAAFNISSIPAQHGSLGDDSILLEIYYLLNVVDPNTITSSWGALQFQHGAAYETMYYQIGMQEAAEGITYFEGSSDSHSIYYLIAEEPPFSMSVGGVDNIMNATGVVQGQYAWYEPTGSFYGLQVGSGGGQSFFYPKPAYQVNEAITVPATYLNRSMPDLAFPANDVAYYGGGSRISGGGGTSFAAPLMAGAFADMESMIAARYGVTTYQLGWLQPILYNLGYGTAYGYTAFSPVEYLQPSGTIQDGSYLGNGWNEWTGIGTPNMLNLTYDFMNYISAERVTAVLASSVVVQGTNTTATVTVSNFGAPVQLTVGVGLTANNALLSWLVVVNAPSTVVAINVSTLLPGLYTVSFSYLGGTYAQELEITTGVPITASFAAPSVATHALPTFGSPSAAGDPSSGPPLLTPAGGPAREQ